MTLDNVVAERFSGCVSVEQTILKIAARYQCSPAEARYVLAEALKKTDSMPEFYERGRLGPEPISSFDAKEIWRSLSHPQKDPEEELYLAIPF